MSLDKSVVITTVSRGLSYKSTVLLQGWIRTQETSSKARIPTAVTSQPAASLGDVGEIHRGGRGEFVEFPCTL